MALQNLVFVIDVDRRDDLSGDRLDEWKQFVKRGILQILLHYGYRCGFDKVRWGYKFFHSGTGRTGSVLSRASDFKDLQNKILEDFEQEFDAKVKVCPSQKQLSSRAVSVQNALKETMLDFQWDRPDITSPTKLSLRPRRTDRGGKPSLTHEDDVSSFGRNVVFVVSESPWSRTHLLDYLSEKSEDLAPDVTENIVSKSLKDMLRHRQVVLHWLDSSLRDQVLGCEDYLGSGRLSEVLAQVGGRVIPLVALLNLCCSYVSDSRWMQEAFTFKSSVGYLLSSERLHRLAFPALQGVLRWGQGNLMQSCVVAVEPMCRRQRLLQDTVEVHLTEVLQDWNASSLMQTSSESWLLQDQGTSAFQHLLVELSAIGLHMRAEVTDGGVACSAILSPSSPSTALLTILHPATAQCDLLKTKVSIAVPSDLPDVVSSVLGVVYDIMNQDNDDEKVSEHPVPEWALQETNQNPPTASVMETWFPQSDQSGVSSDLMESLRLLHAVPEQKELEETSVLQQELVSGLSELYQTSQDLHNKRGKKRGAHCTPVKQKMKTMSRSLQMLNVARLNVKAQKSQNEAEQQLMVEKPGKRQSSGSSKSGGASTDSFSSEEELLCHLKSIYDKTLADGDSSLLTAVKQLLAAGKTFFVGQPDCEVQVSVFIQMHLLKTSRSIRQLYGAAGDVDSKVRECQLQVLLRVDLCSLLASKTTDLLDADQMAEEAAEMLRIISLTKDPVYVSRFLQDELLPEFLAAVPRVLADIYHSLGTQMPEVLVAVLPADFFSDESVTKNSVSPSTSLPPVFKVGPVSEDTDDLQDLRDSSISRRRSGMLTRRRSMTESSQSFRQIEIPKKNVRAHKSTASVTMDNPAKRMQPQKQETQEVTKVRRNLFNEEIISPSKRTKLHRSQSVSAVERLKKQKRSQESEEQHRLLTKKVCETPLHKQVSNRLLHRQKRGRSTDISKECTVEESPVKPAEDLRRSPRIQKLSRRHSSVFYSSSQPRSRNLDRALSSSQLTNSDVKVRDVRSPIRLLFGAADSPTRTTPGTRATRSRLSMESCVFESPKKTPTKSPCQYAKAVTGTARTPTQTPSKRCVTGLGMTLKSSPFRSPSRETPTKAIPLKGILRTPVKASGQPSEPGILSSPVSKTPRKSVTWSPSPQKCRVAQSSRDFKIPESPKTRTHSSPRVVRTPSGSSSPSQSSGAFKTHSNTCQLNLVRVSEHTFLTPEHKPNRIKTPEKAADFLEVPPLLSTPPSDQHASFQFNRSPSPAHQMSTRSGQTPPSQHSPASSPAGGTSLSGPPVKFSTRVRSSRCRLKSQSSDAGSAKSVLQKSNRIEEVQPEVSSSETDSSLQMESQKYDSSPRNSASADDDSLDIVDAAVVKTQFSGGLKMNICFSRKPSLSDQDRPPKRTSFQGTPSHSYGFRQTPDRQQREAAARLGYGNDSPRSSTPRGQESRRINVGTPLTYQVELEMQTSGLPKLKIKRTDSMNAHDPASDGSLRSGSQSPLVGLKPHTENHLALFPKQRDPGCGSPSVCAHVTPAKTTPGKSIQTFICQSYTPTHHIATTTSPTAAADLIPLTPSPQSASKVNPDNLNSWRRRKRAQIRGSRAKDHHPKGEPQLEEMLEEAELGVSRLQDLEDPDEASSSRADDSPVSPLKDLFRMEKLAEQTSCSGPQTAEEENGTITSTATPPSSVLRKPVTPSGILALTQSPLLFRTRPRSAGRRTSADEVDVDSSPFSRPVRHSKTATPFSRKRLIH